MKRRCIMFVRIRFSELHPLLVTPLAKRWFVGLPIARADNWRGALEVPRWSGVSRYSSAAPNASITSSPDRFEAGFPIASLIMVIKAFARETKKLSKLSALIKLGSTA